MERRPQKFLRLNLNADRCGNIALSPRLNDREQPALILHRCGETKLLRGPVISAHSEVGERASDGHELVADF